MAALYPPNQYLYYNKQIFDRYIRKCYKNTLRAKKKISYFNI